MKIVFAASELTPYAKTGGLGDVVASLAAELAARGHEVTCIVPFYRSVREAIGKVQPTGISLQVPLGSKHVRGDVLETTLDSGVRLLLVRRDEFFDRSELYQTAERDYDDNAERFLFFSKMVVELLSLKRFQPQVVHCHDWQTGFVPAQVVYWRQTKAELPVKTVFTIHNLAYQGVFWQLDFPLTNLPGEFFTTNGFEFYGQLNLMKGGIMFADALTTVSRKYAEEIQTPSGGFGLDGVLRARSAELHGIANGVDYHVWNPATDPWLSQRFDAANLDGKRACREHLLHKLKLSAKAGAPVVAVVSRFTELKGIDLLIGAAEELLRQGALLVVLGKGAAKYEVALSELARQHPRQLAVRLGLDEDLAHQIQAGADLLLMPSKSEPCGLTQMYALKYGTIPVVRAIGGLDDTVRQFDATTGRGTGFKFTEYTTAALLGAVRAALAVYHRPEPWRRLVQNAMACDFSWKTSARRYEQVYAALVAS